MGIGNDRRNYNMMDVTACYLKDSNNNTVQYTYPINN